MNRQTVKRLVTKGIVTYVAVFALVLMVAMPALALMVNSVGTREIQDHSIRSRDLRNKAVTTDRIAPRAVRRGKIAKRAIRNEHIYNNINDSKIRYSTKTRYRSIPAAAFQPFSSAMAYLNLGASLISESGVWVAEVDLPDGAKIKSVRLTTFDSSATADVTATVARTNYTSTQAMATVQSSGAALATRNFTDNSINFPTINNRDYAYFASVFIIPSDGNLLFGRILIAYEIKAP